MNLDDLTKESIEKEIDPLGVEVKRVCRRDPNSYKLGKNGGMMQAHKNKRDKVDALLERGKILSETNKEKAIDLLYEAKDLAESLAYAEGLAKSCWFLVNPLKAKGNFEKALFLANESLTLNEPLRQKALRLRDQNTVSPLSIVRCTASAFI